MSVKNNLNNGVYHRAIICDLSKCEQGENSVFFGSQLFPPRARLSYSSYNDADIRREIVDKFVSPTFLYGRSSVNGLFYLLLVDKIEFVSVLKISYWMTLKIYVDSEINIPNTFSKSIVLASITSSYELWTNIFLFFFIFWQL